ncbi:MAG: hypothetical protein A2X61_11895 [Ignavibacteria bacterium GWB2_35_12]|nr:MAG: hypothetical protein A2X63_05735 [Ignavibacteria bacterium GWA2_35_8]OGU41964.1 MAG: hypothetical protein A2X61_11895 [Ignavibacteria bacterium GWB2_35_12]OGU96069.1 MAG: hypothetical protein A2220_14800 [Ignavibacteria bacterium RIFOXYA2_FULL_35_10]OGV24442.1 MAG: hypothetical protein A2475_12705 [Ignavibacteria bacterium RIFOXYC2_FULL_35_21]
MTIDETIQYWIETAENDLETAESLYNSGHYDWCLFLGHLVLEKILKAHWVKFNKDVNHPKIHNLLNLAKETILNQTEDELAFLRLVNNFHLENRYPDYKKEFHKIVTKEYCLDNFNKIKERYQWFKSQLK